MARHTKITYCDSTVNPFPTCTGCELWYPGMEERGGTPHCYAQRHISRYAGRKGWPDSFNTPTYFPRRVPEATKWKATVNDRSDKPWLEGYPRIIFLNDMGELWSSLVTDEQRDEVFTAIANEKKKKIWMAFTKKPREAVRYIMSRADRISFDNLILCVSVTSNITIPRIQNLSLFMRHMPPGITYGISFEPIIGPVDRITDSLIRGYDWIAVGGESGEHARPFHISWMKHLNRVAANANIKCFNKQLGNNSFYRGEAYLRRGNLGFSNFCDDWNFWPDALKIREMFPTK